VNPGICQQFITRFLKERVRRYSHMSAVYNESFERDGLWIQRMSAVYN
jgi:hypothetical protein